MLVRQNENIEAAYLEEVNKVFNDLPNEMREHICDLVSNVQK